MGERHDDPTLEALLAAAVRVDSLDPGAQDRALAAFRAARQTGAHGARTRRRDDWRPRAHRRLGRSLRATLAALVTSVALGGVAIASIGSVGTSGDDSDVPRPSKSTPDRPAEGSATTPERPGQRDGFSAAPSDRDHEAGHSGGPVKKPGPPVPRKDDRPTTPNKPGMPGKSGEAVGPSKNPGNGPTRGPKN
ncbi:hypothetical protein [Streptomyces yerevanensis]|uniref:hypothetical protein n=1 Tax=Streptomyces yerevanensis TaxID=66378 RepID=UPI00068A754C|nr:hypothetical protein [Streptomyces yerevanensis]